MNDTTLLVTGMTCRGCVGRVDRSLRELDGVDDVEVELRTGVVRIHHTAALTATQLAEQLSAAGYPSRVA